MDAQPTVKKPDSTKEPAPPAAADLAIQKPADEAPSEVSAAGPDATGQDAADEARAEEIVSEALQSIDASQVAVAEDTAGEASPGQAVPAGGDAIGPEIGDEADAGQPVSEAAETVDDGDDAMSENRFEAIVVEALDGVGGTMLFSMTIGDGDEGQHVAAGAVGEGSARHFLILSMPTAGGDLRVEQAKDSKSPVARIAASYAGLADVFAAAA